MEIKNDEYAENLLKAINLISNGLKHYIDRTHTLQNELDVTRNMYNNRIEEHLKLQKKLDYIKENIGEKEWKRLMNGIKD